MSLLTSTNAGSASVSYFIENIGGPGTGVGDAPVIKGSTLGTVVVGDPANGLRLRGDTVANANAILGGQANGGSLSIGNSVASPAQIALTDGVMNVSGIMAVAGSIQAKTAGATPASLDTYTNRDIHGFSDTGYSVFSVPIANPAATPTVANPVGLSPGLWSVIFVPPGAPNIGAQVSAIMYWDGAAWTGAGDSTSFTGGAPNMALLPSNDGTVIALGGASKPADASVLNYRQLLAAPGL
jgi:hypothetical protein